jgi:LmbE family N-acetylglucosaminyl deacetylase
LDFSFAILALAFAGTAAWSEPELGAVALHQALLDLGTDLRLMCVAAHPDDEDGATLALYRKKYGYKTFALLGTRGEGGQNEIGPELYEELGVIRTHEMLRASAITGADLHFLDMPEFGFSKSREEAFAVWGREETRRRMVRKIRELRPDVIITHHGPRGGHGHHQAIGQSLEEAFDAASDPAAFPEQFAEGLEPWQPARLYVRGRGEDLAEVDSDELDPVRGYTYTAIAGQALREHESQGMGFFVSAFASSRRFPRTYHLVKQSERRRNTDSAQVASPGGSLFGNVPDRVTSEAREVSLAGTGQANLKAKVFELLTKGVRPRSNAWARANALAAKLTELQLDTRLSDEKLVAGQTLTISAQLSDFGAHDADRVDFSLEAAAWVDAPLPGRISVTDTQSSKALAELKIVIPTSLEPTIPHPEKLFSDHFFQPQFTVVARVKTRSGDVELRKPVLIDVAPAVSLEFAGTPYLLRKGAGGAARFELLATNHSAGPQEVNIAVSAAAGLGLEAGSLMLSLDKEGTQKLIPLNAAVAANLAARDYSLAARIEGLKVTAAGTARVVDLAIPENIRVGVIESYDTTFMTTLERLGVPHKAILIADFTPETLDSFTTIIVDIRAYLVRQDLVANNQALLDYVSRGGTALVMYHKTYEWNPAFAPYPIAVSRNRVTVEEAPINLLVPEHPLFNTPNKIVDADWDGWIQERGLYFPNRWDDAYTPLVDVADPGESPEPGSVLIADFGQGKYLYTALGWYRQLRELHPGTVRMFANMLAL